MLGRRSGRRVHRIVDRPEHHEAPGAWEWEQAAREQLDAAASSAARRFLGVEPGAEECWRCEAAHAASALGLCAPCLDELRTT